MAGHGTSLNMRIGRISTRSREMDSLSTLMFPIYRVYDKMFLMYRAVVHRPLTRLAGPHRRPETWRGRNKEGFTR
jgi:hypothetical protein